MFRSGDVNTKPSVHSAHGYFIRAAQQGYLEPIIDREGQITKDSSRGFNNKHLTALRRINCMSRDGWTCDEVLEFSNGVLNMYLNQIG
jgi:hypothetical protein